MKFFSKDNAILIFCYCMWASVKGKKIKIYVTKMKEGKFLIFLWWMLNFALIYPERINVNYVPKINFSPQWPPFFYTQPKRNSYYIRRLFMLFMEGVNLHLKDLFLVLLKPLPENFEFVSKFWLFGSLSEPWEGPSLIENECLTRPLKG